MLKKSKLKLSQQDGVSKMLVTTLVNNGDTLGSKLDNSATLLSEIEKVKTEISIKLKSEYRDVWLKSLQTKDDHTYIQFLIMAQECAVEKLKRAHS